MTTQQAVDSVDHTLLAIGTLVAVAYAARCAVRRRDPLRGAPLRPNRLDPVPILIVIMVYLGALTLFEFVTRGWKPAGAATDELARQMRFAVLDPFVRAVGVVACVVVARRYFRAGLRGFGLGRRPVWRDAGFAVVALLAATPVIFVLLEGSEAVLRWWQPEFEAPAHTVITLLHDDATNFGFRLWLVFGAVVAAPLAEEAFFRGLLQTQFKKALRSRWAAIALTGLMFGLIHADQQPQAFLPLAFFGLVLGFAYERTGSLLCPIFIHALFNGRTLLYQWLIT